MEKEYVPDNKFSINLSAAYYDPFLTHLFLSHAVSRLVPQIPSVSIRFSAKSYVNLTTIFGNALTRFYDDPDEKLH